MRWSAFAAEVPEMAARGRTLLTFAGIGLGYLATVRKDGGPRFHPFCPVFHEDGLYALIIPSPKREDLLRDGRFALHAFPLPDVDDEFYATGRVVHHRDPALRDAVRQAFLATGGHSTGDEELFEFDFDHALLATYAGRGIFPPVYTKWRARS